MQRRFFKIAVGIITCLCLAACSHPEGLLSSQPKSEVTQEIAETAETAETVVESKLVTCEYAVNAIASIIDTTHTIDDLHSYAVEHKYLLYLDEIKPEDVISYRDAAVMLYNALHYNPHPFILETVVDQREVEGLDDTETAERSLLFLYRWGVLYDEVPIDWYADITVEALEEMLIRVQTPALRQELLPDISAQIRAKLDEAVLCTCTQKCVEADLQIAKAGLQTYLLEQENLQLMLDCSYWFIEQPADGLFCLSMFTGVKNFFLFSRYYYDSSTEKGQALASQMLAPCNLSEPDMNITYAACMDDKKKEMLEEQLLERYLQMIKDNSQSYSRFFEECTIAYVAPRQGDPSLMLVCFDGEKLHSETFFRAGDNINSVCDQLTQSWYHVYDEG